jgi:hypothetical protein
MDYKSIKRSISFTEEEYELDIKEREVVIGSYLLDIQGYMILVLIVQLGRV